MRLIHNQGKSVGWRSVAKYSRFIAVLLLIIFSVGQVSASIHTIDHHQHEQTETCAVYKAVETGSGETVITGSSSTSFIGAVLIALDTGFFSSKGVSSNSNRGPPLVY